MIRIFSMAEKKKSYLWKRHSIISKNASSIDFFNKKLEGKKERRQETKTEVQQFRQIYYCFNDDEKTCYCFNIPQLNNYNHSLTTNWAVLIENKWKSRCISHSPFFFFYSHSQNPLFCRFNFYRRSLFFFLSLFFSVCRSGIFRL